MSLHIAAQHMASRGRGPDTQLVHMAPSEVAGLKALARAGGGELTTNPDTGLPEAGFLSKMLPMLIGAGITAATGGAAAPWMVGLGMGGLETLRTGSLQKGIMAGLGGFGGAGLAGGLMGAGVGAAQDAAMAGLGEGASQAAMNQAAADATAQSLASPLSTMGAGITNPSAALSSMGGGMGATKYGLAALAPAAADSMGQKRSGYTPDTEQYRYSYAPGMVQDPNVDYTGAATGERRYFNPTFTRLASGGAASVTGGTSPSTLGDYSDGGRLLKGPGDGVSDSIPATIADKRPARLADGEFVVPARIVSELGNGSTEAGARKLYAMMDRVQKARGKTTGKDRVAVNSRAERMLPA